VFQRRSGLALYLGIALGVALVPPPARAASVTLQGTIGTDDAIQLFNVTVATAGLVDIRSYGYAGGVTSTGALAQRGGFDTILTLFDSAGLFLADNDDGAGAAADPLTGLAADARITANLAAGSYIVALTQYDNFAAGFNLSDGFFETGHPNFTADPAFTIGGSCAGNLFRDISGTAGNCRTGNWTLDFVNVAAVTSVPEPSAGILAGVGLGLLLLAGLGRKRTGVRALLGIVLLCVLAVSVQAQASDPDYSNVSDFLSGQRTLLQITNLQVASYNTGSGTLWITPVTTANSQQTTQPQRNFQTFSLNGQYQTFSFSVRMFNQPQATTFTTIHTVSDDPNASNTLLLTDAGAGWFPLTRGDNPFVSGGVAADFNLDGFEDLAVAFQDGRIMVGAPNNVNDLNAGWHQTISSIDTLLALTAGDFNGDGKQEIAGLTFAPNGGLKLVIYNVDPVTLAVTPASSLVLTTPGSSDSNQIGYASISRGRFNAPNYDQLAVSFATIADQAGQPGGPAYIEVVDFTPGTLNPREGPQIEPSSNINTFGFFQVKAGKFNFPTNPYDQIVYLSASPQAGGRFFQVFSVDPTNLVIAGGAQQSYDNYGCGYDLQVGNFDNRQSDPSNPGQTIHNPNAQIAVLAGGCGGGVDKYINVYSADPRTFALTSVSSNLLPQLNGDSSPPQLVMLATDIQGRSLSLGEPSIIDIDSSRQPTVVVGAPPTHVDFISPDPFNNAPPIVLNLSAVPEGFKTTYDQQQSSGVQASTTHKTSWSFGAKETGTASITVGDPDTAGFQAKDTISAAQNLKSSSDNTHGTFTGKSFDLSDTTGFGDEVSYVKSTMRIWLYPVIGQTVCPREKPNCPDNEKVQATIQFSAPAGDPTPEAAQGQSIPWYQPPWAPGNIFSYPANLEQLEALYPDVSPLAQGQGFLTDTSTQVQKTTWTVTTNDTTNTSFNQNYSFKNDFSVTASAGLVGGGYSINLSGSYGLSTLTNTSTTLATSTGVQINKPGTFPLFQNYGYYVTPYIMGTKVPGGVVDNQPLSTDVQTFGLVRAMYTADPTQPGAGMWWAQAYNQAPDVALNHPSRWYISTPGLSNPIPKNCLATGTGSSQMDCAELSPRTPDDAWLSTFHQMRGFFISNSVSPGQGPQLEQANVGDVLTLQARVYNYSLARMPEDTEVHVRFYFAPGDGSTPPGDSVLINETKLPAILPFNGAPGAPPNWLMATTTFDTGKFDELKAGGHIAFWVVVWMQTPGDQGKLEKEMPGHGLTAIPGTLKSLADVAEECQPDGNCYSNNVGFYNQAFFLVGPSLSGAPGPVAANSPVDIGKVDASAYEMTLKDNVVLSATLVATAGDASGVSANIYDGDPKQGGRLINVVQIPHIAQGTPCKIRMQYRTNTCGVHQIFVVVNKGKPSEVIRRAHPLRVACGASR
jgi:hypothetical protein